MAVYGHRLEYEPGYDPAHAGEEADAGCAEDGGFVREMNEYIDNELTGLEQAVARADRAVGGSADTARLAEIHGRTMNNIYATRSKYREKIRQRFQSRQGSPTRTGRKS